MMKKVTTLFAALLFVFGVASPVLAAASPMVTSVSAKDCEARILGIPPWYRGLTEGADCTIKDPSKVGGIGKFIWLIVLNGIEMAVVAAAYIAVFFIMYGGFLFMTGGSMPGQVEKGRKTLTNAIVGLIITMAALALTNLVFNLIK